MTRIATKDTFGYVKVGDNETRHQIVAGQEIPDIYRLEDESAWRDADDRVGILGPASYKDRQVSQRLERDNSGDMVVQYEPEQVLRLEENANPTAANEPELANQHSPLANEPLGSVEGTKKRSERADAEQAETRASEEGDTPAARIEKRLKSGKAAESEEGAPSRGGRRSRSKASEDDSPPDETPPEGETPSE